MAPDEAFSAYIDIPLIVLDEIDKANGNFAYGDPLGPLHNLLEPESAKLFEDGRCERPFHTGEKFLRCVNGVHGSSSLVLWATISRRANFFEVVLDNVSVWPYTGRTIIVRGNNDDFYSSKG